MRFVGKLLTLTLKILALAILAPLILALIAVLGAAAIVAVPILWQRLIRGFSAPPDQRP